MSCCGVHFECLSCCPPVSSAKHRSSTDWHNSMSELSAWCFNHNWMAQSWLCTMNSFISQNYKTLIFHPGIFGIFLSTLSSNGKSSQGRPSVVTRLWLCNVPSCIQRVVADLTLEDRTCLNLLFSSCMLGDLGLARWRPPRLFSPFTPPSARNTWSTDNAQINPDWMRQEGVPLMLPLHVLPLGGSKTSCKHFTKILRVETKTFLQHLAMNVDMEFDRILMICLTSWQRWRKAVWTPSWFSLAEASK